MIGNKIEKERKAIRVMMGSPCLLLYVHHWYTVVTYMHMLLVLEISPIYTFFIVFRYTFIVQQFAACRIQTSHACNIFTILFVALYFVDEVYVRGFVICVHIT